MVIDVANQEEQTSLDTNNTKRTKSKKSARRKTRAKSSVVAKFPRDSLERVLRIPKAIIEQNAGKLCTLKQAAEYVGVSLNGSFKVEISSAKKFGLIDQPANGQIQPTILAKQILKPQSSSDVLEGYREAVLKAPEISDVYKHYRGENLPDDVFLQNTVVDTYKIPAENFAEFKQILISSLEIAQLIEKHGDKIRVLDVSDVHQNDEPSDRIKKLGKVVHLNSGDTCFVMQPFSPPLGDYYEKLYKPAIEKAGLIPIRADADIFGTGKIMDQVWQGITKSKILVAELTSRNPNVFYELGLAHALKKPVVLVSAREEDVPFDLKHIRVIYYDVTDPFWGEKLIEKVAENILSAIKNPEEAIFQKVA